MGGEHEVFERLVADHRHRIAVLAYRLLGWPAEVDDVVQDVFMAALTNLKRFRGDAQIGTWLTSITVNICRKRRRRQKVVDRFLGWARGKAEQSSVNATPDSSPRMEAVRQAVMILPDKYREVIVLHYLAEMPVDQICSVLGMQKNAVEVRLSRARRMLREQIELADEGNDHA